MCECGSSEVLFDPAEFEGLEMPQDMEADVIEHSGAPCDLDMSELAIFDKPESSRTEEILGIMRTHIGYPAAAAKRRWDDDGIDDNAKEQEMKLLALMGLVPVVSNLIHYGDDEIMDACARMYRKMGVSASNGELREIIKEARANLERTLSPNCTALFDLDGNEYSRYVQASERYMANRLSEIKTWTTANSFRFDVDRLDNEIGGVMPGEICVVAGAPGAMKTSLAISGLERSLRNGQSVLFVSLDMDPGEIQERRILARTHFSQQMLKFLLQRNDTEEIYAARDEINRTDKGVFRLVGSKDMTVDADVLTDMMLRERPQVVIVDYLTRLRGKTQCDLDCVNDAMPKIKDATQQAGCRTILLSQMSRQSKSEQAKGKLGGHSKGGGIVEELAHSEIELVKDAPDSDDEQPAKIIATITKNRRGPSGRSFSLAYIPDSMKFTGHAFPVQLKTGGREPLFTGKEETTE